MTTNSPNPVDGDVQALIERIGVALKQFTSGRASMHVPPLDTDVDIVLADCEKMLKSLKTEPDVLISEEGALAIRSIINREISGAGRYVIFERPTFTSGEKMMPLYTTPPAQLLRPVELPKKIERDDADGYWMHKSGRVSAVNAAYFNEAIKECAEVLRRQGFEVKS